MKFYEVSWNVRMGDIQRHPWGPTCQNFLKLHGIEKIRSASRYVSTNQYNLNLVLSFQYFTKCTLKCLLSGISPTCAWGKTDEQSKLCQMLISFTRCVEGELWNYFKLDNQTRRHFSFQENAWLWWIKSFRRIKPQEIKTRWDLNRVFHRRTEFACNCRLK